MTTNDDALALIELALLLDPEGEGLDLSDVDYELEKLIALKNRLSSWRHAIDTVNRALAQQWREQYPGAKFEDEHTTYWLGRTKSRKATDKRVFYEWLATKNAAELSGLVADYNIKVGGMTQAERDTLLDESPTTDRLSIQSKLR